MLVSLDAFIRQERNIKILLESTTLEKNNAVFGACDTLLVYLFAVYLCLKFPSKFPC